MSDLLLPNGSIVHDGDTVYRKDGEADRLRFMDTPEVLNPHKQRVAEPGAEEATQATALALSQGYEIRRTGEKDRHGRALADVESPNGGPSLANDMVAAGLARPGHWRSIDDGGASLSAHVRPGADKLFGGPASDLANDSTFKFLAEEARNARLTALAERARSGALAATVRDMPTPDPRTAYGADDTSSILGQSIARGVDGTQGTFYGFADAIGRVTGADWLSEFGEAGVARNITEAMRNPAHVASWEDVDGLADFGIFALEAVGEGAPELLMDLGIGVASGGTAVLGRRALAGGAKTLLRQAGGADAVTRAREIGAPGFANAATRFGFAEGAQTGALVSMYMQNAGESHNQFVAEGIDNPEGALMLGAGKAALDFVGLKTILSQGLKGFGSEAVPVDRAYQLVTRGAAAAGIAYTSESLTEATQTLMDEMAIAAQKPGYEVNYSSVIDAMLKGGIVGGTAAGTANVGSNALNLIGQKGNSLIVPRDPGTDQGTESTQTTDRGDLAGVQTVDLSDNAGVDTSDPLQARARAQTQATTLPGDDAPAQATDAEPVADIRAQIANTPEGEGNWYTAENAEQAKAIAQETGKPVRELADGSVVVAPAEVLQALPEEPTQADLAQLNGYAQTKEEAAADPAGTVVVETRAPTGEVLRNQLVGQSVADQVVEQQIQKFPDADVQIKDPVAVVEDRRAAVNQERGGTNVAPRTLGSAVSDVDLTPAPPITVGEEITDEPLTPKAAKALSDDELRARLERAQLEAIEEPTPTGEKTYLPEARANAADAVISRVEKAWGIASNTAVLSQLLGRGEVGKRVQQSEALDMLAEARTPTGRAKIEQALADDAVLADVIDRLNLRGKAYELQDVVENRLNRGAATRALLSHQAPVRKTSAEREPAAPVDPESKAKSAKVVENALNASAKAKTAMADRRRARAARAGRNAPVTKEGQANEETSTRTIAKDTKAKEDPEQDAWEAAVLAAVPTAELDAAVEGLKAQGLGAFNARRAAERQAVIRADVVVEEKYAGDRVAYLMAEQGKNEESAHTALGKNKPKASKVAKSETTPAPARKQQKDATVPFQRDGLASDSRAKDESGITAKGATDGLSAYAARLRSALEELTDAGTRLFAQLYTPPRLSAERRADLSSSFKDMLDSLGLADRQGKGVQGLAAALIVAARDTASGITGDVEATERRMEADDGERTEETVVAHNPQRRLDDAVEMERLAERLLRGESDARAHRKLVRDALRILFPASDFGLRRQTNQEIESDGRDPSEVTYVAAGAANTNRLSGTDSASKLFQDLLLERLVADLVKGADSIGDATPNLNAVSSAATVALRGDKAKHAAALDAVDQPMVDAYRNAITLDLILHGKEDPEFSLTMDELRTWLRDPATRDAAIGALKARLRVMPSPEQMEEAIGAELHKQTPGTNESNAANAKGATRSGAHRGDEELSNSVFGYFMNRAVAWIDAVVGLGQRYKRAGSEPRVFDTYTVVALDAETFYEENGYSLTNLRPGDYVNDPRFQVHFWTVRRPGEAEATVLRTPGEVKDYFAKLRAEAEQSGKPLLLAAHNASFDAQVLEKAYGINLQGGERWVNTVSLFRAADPQAGVTKESSRPSHRLEVLAERLRKDGVAGIEEKDSAANTAVSGKRMPWNEGNAEVASDAELAAFEDYAKNDTSVVLAALDHFDPSQAFVDLSNAEVATRRGSPGSSVELMAAMAKHAVVPAVGFGRMNDSSRRMTTAARANNLMPLTLVENGVPRDVFVDMAMLAHYSQSGEHRPSNVLEAYQNLTANLSRMMTADPDITAGDKMRAVPHIEPVILPDSLVIHFAQGKPATVADARKAEAAQIRAGVTRAETPRVRAQEQMKIETIDQIIEELVDERTALESEETSSNEANDQALELINQRASGELNASEAARAAARAGDKVKSAYYAILRAKMKAAEGKAAFLRAVGVDISAEAAIDLDTLFDLRGQSLATLRGIKAQDAAAKDLATVSDVQDDKDEDVLLAEARAKDGYDEVDASMRRKARIDADRAWMDEGSESPQARVDDYGKPQLESRRMEDDIRLEGEQTVRDKMANPAQIPGYVRPRRSAPVKAASEPVSTIGAPTRRAKGDSDFRKLTGRETSAVERMVSTLDGFASKQVQAVRDLLSRVAERGVPVLGATLIPLRQGGMVEGAPERVLNRLGITPTLELVTALREGRSFYAMTSSGPVIGIANFGDSPRGRAHMLNDLAHELGHMVRDRVWDSMDDATREAVSRDFEADHPEQMTEAERRNAEHEWFANRMAEAVLTTLQAATEGVSNPVARLMNKMYSTARQLWAGLNMALGRSAAFDKFALELFAGTYRDAGTNTRLATKGATEVYNADGYERVRKQATAKLRMAQGGATSAWKKGVLPAMKSMLANVATRIEHFDPLLSRQLFQGANANSTGKRAFEQNYRAVRARLRGAIEKTMLGFKDEAAFQQAFSDLIQGRDVAGAKEVGALIEGLQTAAREAGLRSVMFRAKEPPMVFDRERVESDRAAFEKMLLEAGFTQLQVREIFTSIVEGEQAIEMSIAPGISVGDHGSNHLLGQRLNRAALQEAGWLLDRHAEALMHWADATAKRAAWDDAFGEYLTSGGAEAAARVYFGTNRVTAKQVAQLREAGLIDAAGRLFHTNHKFVQRLDLIERVHGTAARQEVMDLTLGALGKHPMGQRMPKWFRNSQDFVLGWLGKTMLIYSGLMSLPEPAMAYARAGGSVGLGDSFRSFGEARRYARDMGIVLSDSAEYMAFQGEQYQSTSMRKIDHWFFKLNGNQAVTNFSRVLATNVAIRYLHSAVETGDTAALARLNVTAEQIQIWEAKGRPAWATHLDPSTRAISAAVGDAINQFVQEASFQPSRFQATHWGNNPYMRAVWQLKHFLFTAGSTLVAGTYREMARRFKNGDMLAAAMPLVLFGVVAMPLAMAAGEARDWLRRLNGQQSEFENPVLDRLIGGVRRTGIFGPAEIGLGVWKQMEWGNGPLAALAPSFSVGQRVYNKALPGESMGGMPREADYGEALRLLIPLMSQNKGLWEMVVE